MARIVSFEVGAGYGPVVNSLNGKLLNFCRAEQRIIDGKGEITTG